MNGFRCVFSYQYEPDIEPIFPNIDGYFNKANIEMSPPNEAPIIPLDCGSLVTFQFSSISGMNWFVISDR